MHLADRPLYLWQNLAHVSGLSAVYRAWEQTLPHPVLFPGRLAVVRSCLVSCLCPQRSGSCRWAGRQTDRQEDCWGPPSRLLWPVCFSPKAPWHPRRHSSDPQMPALQSGLVDVPFPVVWSPAEGRRGATWPSAPSPSPHPCDAQLSLVSAVPVALGNRRCVETGRWVTH